jgi:transglutaminase-like putative cysteine protease
MNDLRRYQVRHETVYAYGGEVAHSHQLLHLTPRALTHQSCSAHRILLDPEPTVRRESLDAFGNPVTRLEYDRPHERLEVVSEATVQLETLPPADAACSETWEEVCRSLDYSGAPLPPDHLDAARYRAESPYVRIKQRFGEYAADCFAPDLPLALCAESLMRKVHREFSYAPGATDITTSGLDAFEARRGVCQDFAHVMLACLRTQGVAARYVSGYLRTQPPAGSDPGLVGADASHAWVSVFCPPLGWIDLDPTNDVRGGADHITVAWGRDFGDVSPLRGVIVGGGRHHLSVRVSVLPG